MDLILLLDFSGSMRAMDFKIKGEPASRADALKLATKEFIKKHPKSRIGIVVFAGTARVLGVPTSDHASLLTKLELVKPGSIGAEGAAIGTAISAGCVQMETSGDRRRLLVLITDGAGDSGFIAPTTAAEFAAARNLQLLVVSLGASGIAPLPSVDRTGKTVYRNLKAAVDEKKLRRIADAGHGQYRAAANLEELVAVFTAIDSMKVERSAGTATARLPSRFYRSFGKVALKDDALRFEEPPKEDFTAAPIAEERITLAENLAPDKPPVRLGAMGAFAEVVLARSLLTVGEPVAASIRMYVPSAIHWELRGLEFLPEGFATDLSLEPTSTTVKIQERPYDVIHFGVTLTPLRAGPITIQPATLQFGARPPQPKTTPPPTGETITYSDGVFRRVTPSPASTSTPVSPPSPMRAFTVSTAAVRIVVEP